MLWQLKAAVITVLWQLKAAVSTVLFLSDSRAPGQIWRNRKSVMSSFSRVVSHTSGFSLSSQFVYIKPTTCAVPLVAISGNPWVAYVTYFLTLHCTRCSMEQQEHQWIMSALRMDMNKFDAVKLSGLSLNINTEGIHLFAMHECCHQNPALLTMTFCCLSESAPSSCQSL